VQFAHEYTQEYRRSRDESALSKAWELYYQVFKRIAKQLPQLTSLELQYVSPRLLEVWLRVIRGR
jgi:FKBP12-rapamycin complex-associated protein